MPNNSAFAALKSCNNLSKKKINKRIFRRVYGSSPVCTVFEVKNIFPINSRVDSFSLDWLVSYVFFIVPVQYCEINVA